MTALDSQAVSTCPMHMQHMPMCLRHLLMLSYMPTS